ncbi:hypothetical protein [Streptomyces sp. SAS_260]
MPSNKASRLSLPVTETIEWWKATSGTLGRSTSLLASCIEPGPPF